MTSRKQNAQGECFMNERQPNSPRHEDRLEWQHRKTRLQWLMWPGFRLTLRKGYQSTLLFFHSKGSLFSSWGLLHYDGQRSPWWAGCDRPQHDRSRSDTFMIIMNFNSYARLFFFHHSCFFLFCFWTWNFIYYTNVSCIWFLWPHVNLQSNRAWKPIKLELSILLYLWGFFLSLLRLQ